MQEPDDFFTMLEKASLEAAIDCRKLAKSKFVGFDDNYEYEATFRGILYHKVRSEPYSIPLERMTMESNITKAGKGKAYHVDIDYSETEVTPDANWDDHYLVEIARGWENARKKTLSKGSERKIIKDAKKLKQLISWGIKRPAMIIFFPDDKTRAEEYRESAKKLVMKASEKIRVIVC